MASDAYDQMLMQRRESVERAYDANQTNSQPSLTYGVGSDYGIQQLLAQASSSMVTTNNHS